ncbi:hypothetical protein D9M73_194390 [compost metagenome]
MAAVQGGAHPRPGHEIHLDLVALGGEGAGGEFDDAAALRQGLRAIGRILQGGQAQVGAHATAEEQAGQQCPQGQGEAHG